MAMEFLLVHAGWAALGVLGARTRWGRAVVASVIGAFYFLLLGVAWFVSGGSGVVGGAVALLATRLASGVLAAPPQGEIELRGITPIINAMLYLFLLMTTTAPQGFPAFGFTPDVLAELRPGFGTATGAWVEQPQRAVAFGALYFLIQGLFELARLRGVFADGEGRSRMHGAEVRVTPEFVELRSSGASGALAPGLVVGGVPLFFGLAFLFGHEGRLALGALGFALTTGAIAVLAYNLWRASCRVTTRASCGLLEVECRWIVGSGKLRLGATALEQLAPSEAHPRGGWSLVLRNRSGTVEVARDLPTREDALALRQLIADRLLGPPTGKSC